LHVKIVKIVEVVQAAKKRKSNSFLPRKGSKGAEIKYGSMGVWGCGEGMLIQIPQKLFSRAKAQKAQRGIVQIVTR
jgi:hypothetical protein